MKIDRAKLKKTSSEVPTDCKVLIEKLKSCLDDELLEELSKVKTWNCGKCELYHWIDVLDRFDQILEISCKKTKENQWCLPCDGPDLTTHKQLLLAVLQFTALLIEHSFSRNFYNSMEHLTALLSSSDMNVVLAVLNLLHVFSKRSNFLTRLNEEKRQSLVLRLLYLAESWGGKENGFGLAECCQNLPITSYPSSASTLHFEYYAENVDKSHKKMSNTVIAIHIDEVDKITHKSPSKIMEEIVEKYAVPEDKQMQLFTHIRLAHSFSDYSKRILCVQARLQALSVLVYCNAVPDNVNSLLYNGFIEELVDVLELEDNSLIELKAAALRTLTSIIHLDKNPKLSTIIDTTGAASYHGFLPVLVRRCIQSLTDPDSEPFPLPFATALFSFLYHLASYESGGDALVSCGMVEALLKVINWRSTETEHITFITRAVRVIDLITNFDMQAFHAHGGLASFIQRLEIEINVCRTEQPFEINPKVEPTSSENQNTEPSTSSSESVENQGSMEVDSASPSIPSQTVEDKPESVAVDSSSKETEEQNSPQIESKKGLQCFPQRSALLKSMLNFLRKSIQDSVFSDTIRHLIDGTLFQSLKHIISNAEYYGPSLFLLAIDIVTTYIYQEPTLLPALQDSGLTDAVNHALLVKEVPATREVLSSLPNVFGALCLNTRGLQSFVACKPFEKLFRVLVSPEYLPAMRRRRSSDGIGDAASNLGNAVDELMRHQPSLRADATAAIIKLLEELCMMGRDPRYVCTSPAAAKSETVVHPPVGRMAAPTNAAGSSSDDEDDEDEDAAGAPQGSLTKATEKETSEESSGTGSKIPIPLVDYILNVMRFVDAILSNNSTDDHCQEFVRQKGLIPLISILGLPNLPIDFPVTPTCQSVSSVCKSILNLAHEPQVLKQGLLQLNEVLQSLEPLYKPADPPNGSVLLEELLNAPNINDATLSAHSTPLLHYMAAAHAYIIMFVHLCRTAQTDIRTISISHWASSLGTNVLTSLSLLYTSLVWESTVLLALCSKDNGLPENCEFGRQQLEKLLHKDEKGDKDVLQNTTPEFGSNGMTSAMEALSTDGSCAMDVDNPAPSTSEDLKTGESEKSKSKSYHTQIKQLIKPLLSGASRLGRALAELFGLLVKLCVGSPMRQRRSQQIPPSLSVDTPAARAIGSAIYRLLTMGLSWEPPIACPVPKFRLTFNICFVEFTSRMLFDETKYPYHLMLQKFLKMDAFLDAFFNTFRWALTCGNTVKIEKGLENPQLPDGTGEFLAAWLVLLEKMVNPKNIVETSHTVLPKSDPNYDPSFDPVLYFIHIHKRAFESIMYLWNRKPVVVYGEKIAESMLTVICHLLKGETIIKEKLSKKTAPGSSQAAAAASSSNTAPRSQQLSEGEDVNQDHLTHLVEMGFSRSLVTEALLNTTSFDQAMDYLLSYPSSLGQGSSSGNAGGHGMDWELSEEDQMLRAIAMSLGDVVSQALGSSADEKEPNKTDEQKEVEVEQHQEEPLSTQIIDEFISQVVGGCIHLADALPDTVYRCCDLLIQVAARNGEEWSNKHLIDFLLAELHSQMFYILERLKADELPEDNKWSFTIRKPWLNVESRFAVRLHLFALIFEEMKIPCAIRIEQSDLMPVFIKILDITALCMNSCPDEPAAKWLPFLVLLIDEYEKAAVASARKAPLLMAQKRQWKWFDERSGKWNNYSLSNNKLIDEAYKSGESTLHFTAIHRNYTVCLRTMVQINDETGNRRPIMFTIIDKEEKEKDASNKEKKSEEQLPSSEESTGKDPPSSENAENSENKEGSSQPVQMTIIKRLTPEQCEKLVGICVSLLKVPLEPDSLHAVMRLCLRLTRNYHNAVLFAGMDGPKTLLSLTVPFTFTGYTSLTALLFRHILEDPGTLRNTMDKVIRSATAQGSASIRVPNEMNYVFRVLGPAACRDPELFTSVASSILRLASLPPSKNDGNEIPLFASTIQMLKTSPSKVQPSEPSSAESEVANNLIYDLLKALITKPVEVPEEATTSENSSDAPPVSDQPSPLRDANSSELIPTEDDDGLVIPLIVPNVDGFNDGTDASRTREGNQATKDSSKTNKPDSSTLKNIPIIQKSGICRLLAELVRSYSQCARVITEYSYCVGDSELISEDCSALAFILDNLLPSIQTIGDRETPVLARVLLAAIASCNHSVEAQTSLVHEVRLALLRALSLPESNEKHTRIQALTGLISMMIDSCPPSHSSLRGGCTLRSQLSMNNIVKILLKKGLVVDLARVPHYLDLSSPHTAVTVNSALKPLETLSRIVNLPCGNIASSKAKTKPSSSRNREAASESMDEDASGAPCTADTPYEVVDEIQDIGLDTTIEIDQDPASFINTGNVDNTISDSAVDISEPDLTVSVEMEETPSSQTRGRRVRSFADSTNDDQQESTDSDSNSESEHSQSEDGVERDGRVEGTSADEDADVDEDADEDDDDDYDYDDDDDTLPFDMIDGYPEVDFFSVQDRDDSLLFQLQEDIARSSRAVILGGSERIRTFQLPDIVDEATNSAENSAPSVPPAPRTVATTHPLLERHGEASSSVQSGVHRRQRGFRPNTGNHGWHVYTNSSNTSARRANRPVILQRLLGPSTAQDLLQLTSNSSSLPTSTALSRVVFENNDVRVTATLENLFDLPDRSSNLPSDSSTLASIPATLNRWAEESRVLDGDSVHDCVTGLKPAIIKCLEAYRDEELAERKEKEKQQQDKSGEKLGPKTPDLGQLISMEVTEPYQHENVESSVNNLPTICGPDDSSETTAVPASTQESSPIVGTISTVTTVVTDLSDSSARSESTIAPQENSDLQMTSSVTPMDTTDAMDTTEDDDRTRTSQVLSHEMLEGSLSALASTPMPGCDGSELPPPIPAQEQPITEEETVHLVEETAEERQSTLAHFPTQFETINPEEILQRSTDQWHAELRTENMSASSDEPQNAARQLIEVMQRRLDQRLAEMSSESRMENMSASSDESQSSNTSTVITNYPRNLSEGPIILEGTVSDPEEFLTISSVQSPAPTVTVSLGSSSSEHPDMTVTLTEFVESSTGNDNDTSSRTQSPSFSPNDTTSSERPTAPSTEATPAVPNVLDGVELPEGVDPSFLAALPDNIRQEVIAEQLRLQRLRQGSTNISSDNTNAGSSFTEVNPEFLAALPENIQEEVLAQQRAEQQRLAAQNSNPDIPLDPTSFIQTLPQGLRQQVLTDMDDSLLALLPPDVASEAHALRREVEARRRQIQERFFTSHGNSTLSRILRSASRVGGRYAIHTVPRGQAWADLDHIWGTWSGRGTSRTSGNAAALSSEALSNSMRLRGRFLLDHEALACLLVLLFVDDPQLNTVRLHRVLRNLCHHGPTRNWVIKSLLSILERTKDGNITSSPGRSSESASRSSQPSWLSISLDAALGCRTNVFQIRRIVTAHRRTSERHSLDVQNVLPNVPLVTIHPLASPVICRHVLDTLISLAKFFPAYFLPEVNKDKAVKDTTGKGGTSSLKPETSRMEGDFWDVLVKLDSLSTTSRKGKAVLRNHRDSFGSASGSSDDESKPSEFETSPFAQLIGLLAHPVMKRSSVLTDRLLHLLAVISLALPDPRSNMKNKTGSDKQPEQDTESTCMSPFHKEVDIITGSGTVDDPIMFVSEDADERRTVQHYLQLAVDVLTSKICSEEGLEDATALLLRISRGCKKTRQTVLSLLLHGARVLGQDVCCNILRLLHELKYNLTKDKSSETDNKEPEYDGKLATKGTIQDRFTNRAVVITAPVKIKGSSGKELHLPSMQDLTSKASNQAFFLRILKVIIQLNELNQPPVKNKPTGGPRISLFRENEPNVPNEPRTTQNVGVGVSFDENMVASSVLVESTTPAESATSSEAAPTTDKAEEKQPAQQEPEPFHLSRKLKLEKLWDALSDCLSELAETTDHHTVLVLQPAVEAFFLVHAPKKDKKKESRSESRDSEMAHIQDIQPASPRSSSLGQADSISDSLSSSSVSSDTAKFLKFAETHRTVLNQILRQSTTPLADGPFSVLVDHTRVLDFDVKRRYFRQELEKMDEGSRREVVHDIAVHVRREHVFEDSYRELHRRPPEEWKNRFYIVFEGEEGQDAGGLLREWYAILSREIFNPMYALFTTSPGDRVTYMINSSSHCNSNHLSYFKFVGRVIAKAVYDNKLLESYFTRSFYKHILGKCVKYTDMESEDYSFYQGLVFLLEHDVKELGYELTFSVEVQEFGVTDVRDLKPNGRNLQVTEENKHEYVRLVCQEKMTGAIRQQLKAFLEGFYEIIPKRLISIFNEQELELLISGLPNIDIDDLKANTEYHKYQPNSLQIQWFWRALKSFDQADRANFLQFVTGTSKVPLQGFSALEGMNGAQKFQIHRDDRSTDRLPSAHTCFNQLDLPAYETYDKLRTMLLKAIHECSEGFGFA